MRERKLFMVLGIVLAILALGIAYAAALNGTLRITGSATATASETNFDVKFTKVSGVTGTKDVSTTGSTAAIDTTDKTKGTFSFTGFTKKGQTQSATWTISNENQAELYANIVANTVLEGIDTEYFRGTFDLASEVIEPNGTTTLTVTVECIKTPVDGTVESGEMTFDFTATASNTGKQLITFTIAGTTYQAEAGMTWGEWCESSYNTDNSCSCEAKGVYHSPSVGWVWYGDVKGSDSIVSGCDYPTGPWTSPEF